MMTAIEESETTPVFGDAAHASLQALPMPTLAAGHLPAGSVPSSSLPSASPAAATSSNSASLYVGDLAPTVTEANLFEVFSQAGPVVSVRICRDAITRRSLCYGYVNFQNVQDAELALDTLNYTPINGKICRLMWMQRDKSLRESGMGNIVIGNLHRDIDAKALHDTFSQFGNILSCKVSKRPNEPSGMGFVQFDSDEAAKLSIKAVDGMELKDRIVTVGLWKRHNKTEEYTNVYVKNLDEQTTEEQFVEMFQAFGKITSHLLSKDSEGKSRGFGFVNYPTHEEAKRAVEEMNNKVINGHTLFVSRAQSDDEKKKMSEQRKLDGAIRGVNLYVRFLHPSIDDARLRKEFGAFGTITRAEVMMNEKTNPPTSREFGFVCYSSPEEATRACTEMNGKELEGKALYVALAQSKDERSQMAAMRMDKAAGNFPGAASFPTAMGPYPSAPMYFPQMSHNPAVAAAALRSAQGFGYPAPQFNMRQQWPRAPQQPGMPSNGAMSNMGPGGMGPGPMGRPPMGFHQMSNFMMPIRGTVPGSATGGMGGAMTGVAGPGNAGAVGVPGTNVGVIGAGIGGPGAVAPGSNGRPFRGARPRGTAGVGPNNYNRVNPTRGAPQVMRNGGGNVQSMPSGPAGSQGTGRPQIMYMPNTRNNPNERGVGSTSGPAGMMMPSGGPVMTHMPLGMDNAAQSPAILVAPGAATAPGASMTPSGAHSDSAIASSHPEDRKQMLGERLFPIVKAADPVHAAKVTGMLLEMDVNELMHLMGNQSALDDKINEARSVLHAHLVGQKSLAEHDAAPHSAQEEAGEGGKSFDAAHAHNHSASHGHSGSSVAAA